MARLVIELTNRCNLRCQHCFEERHAATGDLSLEVIEKVLREGKSCGIDHLAFTGRRADHPPPVSGDRSPGIRGRLHVQLC